MENRNICIIYIYKIYEYIKVHSSLLDIKSKWFGKCANVTIISVIIIAIACEEMYGYIILRVRKSRHINKYSLKAKNKNQTSREIIIYITPSGSEKCHV